MNPDLLSVVVPVYNVAQYLDRCIQSILAQTYRNLEVILVNDGSTDGSEEICAKYAQLDSRIMLISQENQGASAARRSGIRLATGKYMSFVDPDDYIDVDLYEQLMSCRANFDVVISQWLRESDCEVRRAYDTIRPGAYQTPEDMEFLIRHLVNVSLPGGSVNILPGIAAYLWNKLFRTELVKEVVEEIKVDLPVSNDRPIIYGVMLRCKSVLITEICGYHYWVRSDSLGHISERNCRYLKSICDFYELMESLLEKDPRYDVLMPQLQMKFSEEITRSPVKMGFSVEAQLQLKTPVFPFINFLEGKRIALYGAGPLGRSYRRQIQKWGICQVALWVDEDWEEHVGTGLAVSPVERLIDENFHYVVIAASEQIEAGRISRKLILMGIEENRILWRVPLEL